MDRSTQKPTKDLLDQRNSIETLLEPEKKLLDVLRVACVTPKNKDPVFATSAVCLIGHGYIPQMRDHGYHRGKLVLPVTWVKGDFYQANEYWEAIVLTSYDARHEYCSLRGDDLDQDLPSWEATTELMTMRTKTLHRIFDLILKLNRNFLMWDASRRVTAVCGRNLSECKIWQGAVAIQQRFVAAKESIELVLEASKKTIPGRNGQIKCSLRATDSCCFFIIWPSERFQR